MRLYIILSLICFGLQAQQINKAYIGSSEPEKIYIGSTQIYPNDVFVSQWNTNNTSSGSTPSNQVKLPLISTGTYDFNVDWGDGSSDNITSWNQAERTHTYSTAGTYTIQIEGTLRGWAFNNGGDRLKILDISSWGIFQPTFGGVFNGCANLDVTATDVIDLSFKTDMSQFFNGCSSLVFNSSIDDWDVSSVTSMNSVFFGATSFNQPLDNWNVSSVTIMFAMFLGATSFNQPLNSWNVSSVTTMVAMFQDATSFNQPLNSWNVSSVTTMGSMFTDATSFSTTNLDGFLNNCASQAPSIQSGVRFDASTARSSASDASVTLLEGTYGWDVRTN